MAHGKDAIGAKFFDLVGIPATETSLVDLLQFELHMKIK